MSFFKWSKTAANNATADPTVNFQEGQSPGSVNDAGRALMAASAKYRDDTSGSLITAGTSTAYTLTTNQSFTTLSAMDGARVSFSAHVANGAAATLNVDGLGAKALKSVSGTALPAGALALGGIYTATYSNSNSEWVVGGYYSFQPLDATLTALAGVTSAADKFAYFTGSDTADVATLTSAGRALIDDADASAQRTTLGLGTSATLNVGTSASNVVQLDGSGMLPAVDASQLTNLSSGGGASLVLVSSQSVTAQSSFQFTGLDGTYDEYLVLISGLRVSADGAQLTMVLGTGAGPTWVTSGYSYALPYLVYSVGLSSVNSNSAASIELTNSGTIHGVGNAAGEALNGEIKIFNPAGSDFKQVACSIAYSRASDGAVYGPTGAGQLATATAVTGIKVQASSGTMTLNAYLYGIKKA